MIKSSELGDISRMTFDNGWHPTGMCLVCYRLHHLCPALPVILAGQYLDLHLSDCSVTNNWLDYNSHFLPPRVHQEECEVTTPSYEFIMSSPACVVSDSSACGALGGTWLVLFMRWLGRSFVSCDPATDLSDRGLSLARAPSQLPTQHRRGKINWN